MVFVPALTTFVISNLLGGSKILLIGNVIEQEFTKGSNWNLGSGLSLVMMIFILISMALIAKYDKNGEGLHFDGQKNRFTQTFCSGLLSGPDPGILYAPIATMAVLSFNSSKSRTQWGGFTTRWYTELFSSSTIMTALYNTLLIAFLSSIIAVIIGTAAAIAINNMKRVPRPIVMGITNIPMLNAGYCDRHLPDAGIYRLWNLPSGFKTILIAHITFNIPYVILSVMPKLKQTDKEYLRGRHGFGATPVYAFFKVVFPDILPGVLSVSCWPLPCRWMISSSPILPAAPASTPYPR